MLTNTYNPPKKNPFRYESFFINDTFVDFNTASSNATYRIDGNVLNIGLSVIGHDPKNVNVELTEDTITVNAKTELDKSSILYRLITNLDETYKLSKEWNGLSASAKIENGLLLISVEKKEENKPKKLSITF